MGKVSEFAAFSGAVDDDADELIIRDDSETTSGVAKDKRMLLRHAVRQIARCAFIDESSDPGPTNDETEGYRVGNLGVNLATGEVFVCKVATEDNAVWSSFSVADAIAAGDDAALLGSGAASEAATDGQVLTADGSGGAAWEDLPSASGDMTKAVYDTDDDGKVDVAERVEETVATDSDSGATHTIDCDTGTVHQLTLTDNCTLSFTNVPSGGFGITLELIQDGTGSRTVTWPASVTWAGGSAPTLTTTASAVDVVTLYTPDGGTTWRGFLSGLAFS